MVDRTRNSAVQGFTGNAYRTTSGVIDVGPVSRSSFGNKTVCIDEISPTLSPRANSLNLVHQRVETGPMHGMCPTGAGQFWHYEGIPPSSSTSLNLRPTTSGDIGRFKDSTKAIADSHPGEPAVSLPVFLFELKDVPDMLKHAKERGQLLEKAAKTGNSRGIRNYLKNPKNPAEDWLNYHFGWAPFIGDAWKMAGLSEYTAKKQDMFRRWNSGKISRRSDLGTVESHGQGQTTYDNTGISMIGNYQSYIKTEKWVVSHWTVANETYRALSEDRSFLIRQALGLDISLTHVWDAMPWTWLTDWFIDIGSVIHAHANRFGITFSDACIMTHKTESTTITPRSMPTGMSSAPSVISTRETKLRSKVSPTIQSHLGLNFLGASQLGVLSSLAVTRGKGSSKF